MKDKWIFILLILVFIAVYFVPFNQSRVQKGIIEAFFLLQEYARQHVLLCLIPAFFIAGAISVFIRQGAIIRYLGAQAKKVVSYSIASVSGAILAVCSCTVLPLFAGIYSQGAGIGPATAFLYSGPAINILAIILTARVLGSRLGLARSLSAIIFAVAIGLIMHLLFNREKEKNRGQSDPIEIEEADKARPLWKTAIYFTTMIGILVFINWGKSDPSLKLWHFIYQAKWFIGAFLSILLVWMITRWFKKSELKEWTFSTWVFAKQILPLLFGGILVAGFLLGRPNHEALIPNPWVSSLVGGNSLGSNLFASIAGALMYFATLTEIPILEGLLGAGMGQGPALALLLAGPALSLPNMFVIRSIIGTKKTLAYIMLVIIMATTSGLIYGVITG